MGLRELARVLEVGGPLPSTAEFCPKRADRQADRKGSTSMTDGTDGDPGFAPHPLGCGTEGRGFLFCSPVYP